MAASHLQLVSYICVVCMSLLMLRDEEILISFVTEFQHPASKKPYLDFCKIDFQLTYGMNHERTCSKSHKNVIHKIKMLS